MSNPSDYTSISQSISIQRPSWARWIPASWLIFTVLPVYVLWSQTRPWYEYLLGSLALAGFIWVFIWVFFIVPWANSDKPGQLRPASLIGMAVCYGVLGLLWPIIGGDGIGMLIYAGAFAGTQQNVIPVVFATVVSAFVLSFAALTGEINWFTGVLMVFFTATAGLSNFIAYRESLVTRALRRSQDEVARIAKIAERERIARDLHDLLGHTLSVIVLKSELASKLAEKNPQRALKEIRDIEQIARQSLQEVRSAVGGYRSVGLAGELNNSKLALEAAEIKLEHLIVRLELEWSQEQALAFCLRESITNVIRHSKAKNCWVSLEQRQREVLLEVWDDGGGTIHDGNGLRGMRERASAQGGTLATTTSSGYTGISLRLPLVKPVNMVLGAGL
jgi:two-component system, NarL family, sensor histidine kinase DesK